MTYLVDALRLVLLDEFSEAQFVSSVSSPVARYVPSHITL